MQNIFTPGVGFIGEEEGRVQKGQGQQADTTLLCFLTAEVNFCIF